ncbi:TetR family transcriptional regulator [Cellulomonas chitinilytica]|uniref:TetR family transcriptional regulator n=1 Tax=Cellulomonas chitinilytica TaxID=398759 RepID=A0A919U3G4_9CELL|nr:TetR/AcrR family transcriptional regulator C-terminal domain-containing protein [Cellulomonas chitinilytica]GIG22417.1 TetR family transcriptional regulator [Cellulomonas chitinilytica]
MKLTRDRVVDAGLEVLAEDGLAGVTMRATARRLDAQAGSLYYHVADRAHLVRLMADRVAQRAYDAGTRELADLPDPDDWRSAVRVQATTLRTTIREHAGGAVLLASAPSLASTGALQLMERLLATLARAGVPVGERAVAADAVLSHVTGFVLQEQTAAPVGPPDVDGLAGLAAAFPLTFQSMGAGPDDEDATFARGVDLLCAGIAAHLDGRR